MPNRKTKRLDERRRKAVKSNLKGWGAWRTSIAGEALLAIRAANGHAVLGWQEVVIVPSGERLFPWRAR